MLESYKLFLRHVKLNSIGLNPENDEIRYLINLKDEIDIDVNFYHGETTISIIKGEMICFELNCDIVGSKVNININENEYIAKMINNSLFMKGSFYLFIREYVLDYLGMRDRLHKIYMR